MSNVIKGADLMLFVGGKSIAFATSHTLEISAETIETTSKDSGGKWAMNQANKLSWSASSENLYALEGAGNDFDTLFAAMVARTPVTLVMDLESGYATKADAVPETGWTPLAATGWTGSAIITSLSLNAANEDNATFSVSFTGTGALTARTA